NGWVTGFRVPVVYGDASKQAGYQAYMGLLQGKQALYALNSRGQRKPILEEGWAEAGSPVTHAVLQITAGSCGAFVGALGNTLWVDNVRMEYAQ
ncbi:MAG: glycoside hydrolase xylanase, partial [Bacteroidales bacterium]|nr:glycoside hydrolase xylanase [Bacteroidales bacterium]